MLILVLQRPGEILGFDDDSSVPEKDQIENSVVSRVFDVRRTALREPGIVYFGGKFRPGVGKEPVRNNLRRFRT